MTRLFGCSVVIFMVIGMGLLAVSIGTDWWRERDFTSPFVVDAGSANEGLFRGCLSLNKLVASNNTSLDGCRDLYNDIDYVPDAWLAVMVLMLLALLFVFLATFFSCCGCMMGKSGRIIVFIAAISTFLSVGCSIAGLSIFAHEYRDGYTLHYSFYLGWAGTAMNLVCVFLLFYLGSAREENFAV